MKNIIENIIRFSVLVILPIILVLLADRICTLIK